MKYLTKDGRCWINVEDGVGQMGFTSQGLHDYGMGIALIPLLGQHSSVKAGQRLAAIEGVLRLSCVTSPLTGTLVENSCENLRDPCELTENTTLFVFTNTQISPSLVKENDALSFV